MKGAEAQQTPHLGATNQGSHLEDNAQASQYLTFLLAGEEYGIEILKVQEIKGWDKITAIPNTPEYILGVINLRGTVVPILDLRKRFELETTEFDFFTVVIVLRVENRGDEKIMGIVVDAVSEVYNLKEDDLKPAPDFGTSVDVRFVRSLASVGEKMLILLDSDKLMDVEMMNTLDTLSEDQQK